MKIWLTWLLAACWLPLSALRAQTPRAEVRIHAGVPALFVDGQLTAPYAYMSYFGAAPYYREAAAAGIHLYNVPAYLGDQGINSASGIRPFREAIWKAPQEYDLDGVEREMDILAEADPAARVIIRLHLDPPLWWERQHPGQLSLQPGGNTFRVSLYSPQWREEAGAALREVVQRLMRSRHGQRLIGVHVAGGSTEEWFYHFKDAFHDRSDVRLQAFRQWSRSDTATLADISGQHATGRWSNDPRFHKTMAFHAENMTRLIAYCCGIVKSASDGQLLTGAFYGYHLFVNDARRGHGDLSTLLRCRDLDYLSSPNDYNRVSGEDWMPMVAVASLRLHGKLWLAENDTRTFKTTLLRERRPDVEPPGDWYAKGVWIGPESPELSVSFLKKNLARMMAYGYGGWWFDMWGGWFSDPRLLAVLKSGQDYFKRYAATDVPQMRPQVAVVADERLQLMDASFGKLTGAITGNRYALGKTGAPFDVYLRSDLRQMPARYRFIWLMGLPALREDESALIRSWMEQGIHVLHTDTAGTTYYRPGHTGERFPQQVAWTADALAELYTKAGVHRYLPPGDVVYAGRGWLAVHSGAGGGKHVRLPERGTVTDPETGKVIVRNSRSFLFELPAGGTRIFRVSFKP
ncbi:hypothetical protein ACWKWU_12500 [Chitinophaga lutea]